MKRNAGKMSLVASLLLVVALLVGGVSPAAAVGPKKSSKAWSFGVIADTQWTVADDGLNPNTTAAAIIKQVNLQMFYAGVKFVVAVGDTVDVGSATSIGTRALYQQELYNMGIGFYPLRGNHEAAENPPDLTSGAELRRAFPQIMDGVNNNTPLDITTGLIPAEDLAKNPPAARRGKTFVVGTNFTEPFAVNTANNGVSYSFRYNNATFMLLDQFDGTGNYLNSTIPAQQNWIDGTLSSRPDNTQAFVFIHKNLLGGNHKDSMFGGAVVAGDPGDGNGVDVSTLTAAQRDALAAKQVAENSFLASLQANKVACLVTGHDHHHSVSVVTSPDGNSKVRQLITASDSSKFYTPVLPVSANDVPIQQDLYRVGYYIFTVDGPCVTIDYYADVNGGADYGLNGGTFTFVKISSITYSLNGKSTTVAQGGNYTGIKDDTTLAATMGSGFKGTSMEILAGKNGGIATTNYGKKISNDVTTSWAPSEDKLASDVLTLSGMSRTLGSIKTDEYVLSMSYDPKSADNDKIAHGNFGLVTRDVARGWVSAAGANMCTSFKYVSGPWTPAYKLGTWGVDTATHTAWAVLNYNGEFSVGVAPGPK